jgi:Protein of unknown function (DUF1194)
MLESQFKGTRRVIDISGDGSNNRGRPAASARDDAVRAGIVINGLPILALEPGLDRYFSDNVIGGPGAFVIAAESYETFADAILKKLIREMAATEPRPHSETQREAACCQRQALFIGRSPRQTGEATSRAQHRCTALGPEDGEDLVGIREPGLDEPRLLRLAAPQCGHRPQHEEPVECFLVAVLFDILQRGLAPARVVPGDRGGGRSSWSRTARVGSRSRGGPSPGRAAC